MPGHTQMQSLMTSPQRCASRWGASWVACCACWVWPQYREPRRGARGLPRKAETVVHFSKLHRPPMHKSALACP